MINFNSFAETSNEDEPHIQPQVSKKIFKIYHIGEQNDIILQHWLKLKKIVVHNIIVAPILYTFKKLLLSITKPALNE